MHENVILMGSTNKNHSVRNVLKKKSDASEYVDFKLKYAMLDRTNLS